MCSSCIRSFSLLLMLGGLSAQASAPTWALPHAQSLVGSSVELGGGTALFPQGGLGLARVAADHAISTQLGAQFSAHEWVNGSQANERFLIGGLRYRLALSAQTAIAPFAQVVLFDGASPLDRRLTLRSGLAWHRTLKRFELDVALPLIGGKSFITHPTSPGFSWLGPLDLLLATEAGVTWTGWAKQRVRVGLMGALLRVSYRYQIGTQWVSAQAASMGSHSLALLGWGVSWKRN